MLHLSFISSEIVLALSALLTLMIGAFKGGRSARFVTWFAMMALFVTGAVLILSYDGVHSLFDGMFIVDPFALIMKILILLSALISLFLSLPFFEKQGDHRFEYPVLILLSTLGMFAMVSAHDMLSLYMGIELQSLALYVLATIRRDHLLSNEAGLKYFILGALSSGILLYGISIIYGYAGTINYHALADLLSFDQEMSVGLIVGIVFLLSGLAFKISAAPFHMWTPDVYQGAPTSVTMLFSMAPKLAGFAVIIRLLSYPFLDMVDQWQQVVVALSALSMIVGALGGIAQTNIKRLLAYSSIGHMGYALMGLASGQVFGVEAIVFYLTVYLIANIGVFAIVMLMRHKDQPTENIADLSGLSKTNPIMALSMTVLMFSMAGIPPMAGFLGKLYVFKATIEGGLVYLAVFGVVTSVIGAYYYLRIVKLMYFDEPILILDQPEQKSLTWSMVISAILSVILIAMPGYVMNIAQFAAKAFML